MEQNKNVSASENSKVLAGRHVYVSHLCLRLLACLLACLLANINNNMSKFFELFFSAIAKIQKYIVILL